MAISSNLSVKPKIILRVLCALLRVLCGVPVETFAHKEHEEGHNEHEGFQIQDNPSKLFNIVFYSLTHFLFQRTQPQHGYC